MIFGAPGSGKGTQSERLIKKYGLHHISTGDVLRSHIKRQTELGKLAESYINQGQLIPDEVMVDVLADIFRTEPEKTAKGVIFDGFPRTVAQAEALNKMLKEYNTEVHAVIGLEVEEPELIRRMLERGKESGRADDNIDTIKKRLDVYHKQTSPLRDYYIGKAKYKAIDGNMDIDTISAEINKHLDSHK